MIRVFVYGTLKRGYNNNRLLTGSTFVATATTMDRWSMLDGGFPVVLPGTDGFVTGEVWEVDGATLARLDHLESNGRMYQREVVEVELADGSFSEAWMYVGCRGRWEDVGDDWPQARPSRADRLTWPTRDDDGLDEEDLESMAEEVRDKVARRAAARMR